MHLGFVHHRARNLAEGRQQRHQFLNERAHAAARHHLRDNQRVAQTHGNQLIPDSAPPEQIQRGKRHKRRDNLVKRKEKSARHGAQLRKFRNPDHGGPEHRDHVRGRHDQRSLRQMLGPLQIRAEKERKRRQGDDGHAEEIAVHETETANLNRAHRKIKHEGSENQIDDLCQHRFVASAALRGCVYIRVSRCATTETSYFRRTTALPSSRCAARGVPRIASAHAFSPSASASG